jgi:hypothetical protein
VPKSSKRKTAGVSSAAKAKGLKILTAPSVVKQELPDIDLTAPMPPASPTDDPLLLSGPPEPSSTPIRQPPPKRMLSHGVQAQVGDLPPSSPMDDEREGGATEGVKYFDWNHHTEPEGSTDFSMELDPADADVPPVQLFDLNPPDEAGGWSDSDWDDATGENEDKTEGRGEYTGKWRMMKVRTKADPPSSATRGRMEQWGRPISPFPKIKKVNWLGGVVEEEQPSLAAEEALQEQSEEEEPQAEQTSLEQEEEERQEEEEVRRMSVEPDVRDESLEEPQNVSLDADSSFETPHAYLEPIEDETPDNSLSQEEGSSIESQERSIELYQESDEEEDEEEREVRQMSVEHDPEEEENQNDSAVASSSQEQAQETLASSLEGAPPLFHASPADGPQRILGVDSSIPFPSLAPSEASLTTHQSQLDENLLAALRDDDTFMHDVEPPPEQQVACSDDEESEDDSSDGETVGVVKISSTDPRAAARAAAILKQVCSELLQF